METGRLIATILLELSFDSEIRETLATQETAGYYKHIFPIMLSFSWMSYCRLIQICRGRIWLKQLYPLQQSLVIVVIGSYAKMIVRKVLSDRYRITQEQFQYQGVEIWLYTHVLLSCASLLCYNTLCLYGIQYFHYSADTI